MATGAWEGFVEAVYVFNAGYVAEGRESPWQILAPFWHLRALTALAVAGAWSAWVWPRLGTNSTSELRAGRPGVVLALILLGVFVLEVIVQGKGYTYHSVPVLLFTTLLAGLGEPGGVVRGLQRRQRTRALQLSGDLGGGPPPVRELAGGRSRLRMGLRADHQRTCTTPSANSLLLQHAPGRVLAQA